MVGQKVALVTGAAGVLGKATTVALLKEGMKVVMVDINKEKLDKEAKTLNGDVYPLLLDVSDAEAVEQAIEKVAEDFGEIDILVNNAGILSLNKSLTTSPEEWVRVCNINLNSVFYLSRAVIPAMKRKKWGRIVNVSSVAAKTGGITAGTAYTASKGGVAALTFSLANELASFGITVNAISPAYVKTPMVTEQLTEQQRQALIEKIPVGRFCEPEEFAFVVSFLVNPLAGFITGEIIDQNGGLIFD